eukprot:TRINITY_DN100700_c0_g1_i1.p1 TRINITY_DN100700_c0_g1~~TRINITY_DN100700_c0_g1_i1.p1  ORF type:complete len:530 (-),score=108.79 TRINITY_DN100700_c0_g1_i1:143-1651(-)
MSPSDVTRAAERLEGYPSSLSRSTSASSSRSPGSAGSTAAAHEAVKSRRPVYAGADIPDMEYPVPFQINRDADGLPQIESSQMPSMQVRNTFYELKESHEPGSLTDFIPERQAQSCPASGCGSVASPQKDGLDRCEEGDEEDLDAPHNDDGFETSTEVWEHEQLHPDLEEDASQQPVQQPVPHSMYGQQAAAGQLGADFMNPSLQQQLYEQQLHQEQIYHEQQMRREQQMREQQMHEHMFREQYQHEHMMMEMAAYHHYPDPTPAVSSGSLPMPQPGFPQQLASMGPPVLSTLPTSQPQRPAAGHHGHVDWSLATAPAPEMLPGPASLAISPPTAPPALSAPAFFAEADAPPPPPPTDAPMMYNSNSVQKAKPAEKKTETPAVDPQQASRDAARQRRLEELRQVNMRPPQPPTPPPPSSHQDSLVLGSPEYPTVGSRGHGRGSCKPCAFVFTKGCEGGVQCSFCHLCPPGEKKRRTKERAALGALERAARAIGFAGDVRLQK